MADKKSAASAAASAPKEAPAAPGASDFSHGGGPAAFDLPGVGFEASDPTVAFHVTRPPQSQEEMQRREARDKARIAERRE